MDDQEKINRQVTLENAIRFAIDGGYKLPLDDERLERYEVEADGLYDDTDFAHPYELAISTEAIIFDPLFAQALWGEKKEEWLGKFLWCSKYEPDCYTFETGHDLLASWVYDGGGEKPTLETLESLPPAGLEATAGIIQKKIEVSNKGWRYHLQQMVIANDRVAYLAANLPYPEEK